MNEIQEIKYKKLIRYLIDNNLYYKKMCGKNDIKDITDFPILRKNDILNNISEYISQIAVHDIGISNLEILFQRLPDLSVNHDYKIQGKKQSWTIEYTTGSSGKPFPVLKSEMTKMLEAKRLLQKRRLIYKYATLKNGFLFLHSNNSYVSENDIWKFLESDIKYIIEVWKNSDIKWLFATPLIFYKYAAFILENGYDNFFSSKLEFVEYTSQKIDKEYEDLIFRAFGKNIINNYGTREVWNIAYQCKEGNLHIEDNDLIVELVDDKCMPIKEYGKIGYIVVTSLLNRDMPLIRYYIGDRASLEKSHCTCGCKSDILRLRDEREIFKIKGTKYYGNKIFRRVMRGIYFHDRYSELRNVKIVQDKINHFSIYIEGIQKNTEFQKSFITRTISIAPELARCKYDFFWGCIIEKDYHFKEEIYKTII